MKRIALSLAPIDTLFFRDGHAFNGPNRPRSGLPLPQTLSGALRTWILREGGADFGALRRRLEDGASPQQALSDLGIAGQAAARLRLRGPWLALAADGMLRPCLPAPADLQTEKDTGRVVRLRPLEDPPLGWEGPEPGMRPLWPTGMTATERASGFLDWSGLDAWCRGGIPDRLIPPEDLFQRDLRTGIVIDPDTLATKTGMIYATAHLVLRPGVNFYAELEGSGDLPPLPTVLPWGGEGRRVLVSTCPPVSWPDPPPAGRRTVLLTAPGLFAPGWRPSCLAPRAAAVPAPVVFSGWDMARGGPKPTRFAAPAGSVYYVEEAVAPGPVSGSLCDDVKLARQGFGSYLEGAWPP